MLHQPNRKTIIFDMDGTLIDQYHVILKCFNHVFESFGFPHQTSETIKQTVGAHLPEVLAQFIGAENVEKATRMFKQHYEAIMHEGTELLPGVSWLLKNLQEQNYKIAILTNKPGSHARAICEALEILHHFHDIFGVDDTPFAKPHKEFTFHALNSLSACPNTAILIGDSIYDVEAAANVGMPSYIVTTGTHDRDALLKHYVHPDGIFDNLYDLGETLFGFKPDVQPSGSPH